MTALSSQFAWRRRLLVIRSVTVSVLALWWLAGAMAADNAQHALRVTLLLALVCLPNLNVWLQAGTSPPWQTRWLHAELAADVVLFLALLHTLGGADNPVAFYLLVPLLVSALAVSGLFSLGLWLAAVSGWGILIHWRLAPASGSLHEHLAGTVHPIHSYGMWLVFALLGLVLIALGQHIQSQARSQRRREAAAMELGLQRERMYQVAARQAHLAHEISTPLNSLLWLLDDLAQTHDDTQRNTLVRRLQQCAGRLAEAVQDTRQQDGKDTPAVARLSQLVAEGGKRGMMLLPGLEVTFSGPEDPQLQGEESWQRVILNLIYNACDAGASRVDVRCVTHRQQQVIQVADNGPEQPGYVPPAQGLGIGLALVETALACHGATLERITGRQWTVARIILPERGLT